MRSLLPFALATLVCAATQQVFEPSEQPYPARKTLVTLLSEDEQFSLFLRACQRARLVPLLNRLNGSTVFAPTNDAIRRQEGTSAQSIWTTSSSVDGDEAVLRDNLQLDLRETILYHLLNYTIIARPSNSTAPTQSAKKPELGREPKLYETLWHPTLRNETFEQPPTLPGTPSDPDPDWPRGRRGQLNWEGQRVRIARTGNDIFVGHDARGQGARRSRADKARWATNGVLLALDGVLDKPVNVSATIESLPELSTFRELVSKNASAQLALSRHVTLFAPTNEAWQALSDLEMSYLRSGFAQEELSQILSDVTSERGPGNNKPLYIEPLTRRSDSRALASVLTLNNDTLAVSLTDGNVPQVNDSLIETSDILCFNGVIHTLPSLLLPSGSLSLTAEKYLIALNATRFVSLLRSVNLSHYVQLPPDSDEGFTILAPNDEVAQMAMLRGLASGQPLPSPGTNALAELLKYHIVPGKWEVSDLQDGQLLETELATPLLHNARQRLPVSITRESSRLKTRKHAIVNLGNAGLLGQPVIVGNSIIYILTAVLEPPTTLIGTAVPDLRLSTLTAAAYAAELAEELNQAKAISYLAPTNDAFTGLGLALSYLLMPSSLIDLQSLVKYHAIDRISYLASFEGNDTLTLPTLEGSQLYANLSGSELAFRGPTVNGKAVNGESRNARIIEGDILTSNGVMHVIDQVEIPPSVEVTLAKLMLGARASTMADLIRVANMTWVLDGVEADERALSTLGLNKGHKKHKKKKQNKRPRNTIEDGSRRSFTLLCPTDKAFSRVNLTYYYSNPAALAALVRLHVIPTNALEALDGLSPAESIALAEDASYRTLLDKHEGGTSDYGQVVFNRWGDGGWMVGIKSARGAAASIDTARVISSGRATPRRWTDHSEDEDEPRAVTFVNGGGVISIDSVLIPYEPNWFLRWGWIVVTVLLALAGVGLVVALSWKLWREKKTRDGYEVVEGEED